MKKTVAGVLILSSLWGAPPATQGKTEVSSVNPVTVTTASYQQVVTTVKDKNGKIKKVKKWVKASKVVPGTIVRYVDTVHNNRSDPLHGIAIKNPIDAHLSYVAGSAKAESNATITYRIDDNGRFADPSDLFVVDQNGQKRLAQPREYRAIQWRIAEVPAGGNVTVEFEVKLK